MEEVVSQKILVTGGLGCIGASLSSYLSRKGEEVRIASRNIDFPDIFELSKCEFSSYDFDDFDSLLANTSDVDCVIHLASLNSQACFENPSEAQRVNGEFTSRILNASIANNVKYFIYFSTAHVYKSPLSGEFDELSPTESNHPYATSHLFGEKVLLDQIKKKKIQGAVFRVSNSVGLPLNKSADCWGLIFNDFCSSAVTDGFISINNNAYLRRDFISLDLLNIITFNFISKKIKSNSPIYNISSGNSISLLEASELVSERYKKLFNKELKIFVRDNSKLSNGLHIKNSKVAKKLNFEFNNNLERNIDEILIYFDKKLNSNV